MDKKELIKKVLEEIGMPKEQQTDLCALTVLAMANVKPSDSFENATNDLIRIHDVIQFVNNNYKCTYAENSRETFRKQAMHHFRNAAIIEDNGMATNSPNYRYKITDDFLNVIKEINEKSANVAAGEALTKFKDEHESLKQKYASKKQMQKMDVKINGSDYSFSTGSHNKLQKAILEQFAPRFAPGASCLYVGDTTKKDLVNDTEKLKDLGFDISVHDKMPDVVLYREDKDWLYFIEAVDSVGPMDPARIIDIKNMTSNVKSGKIYVTAFLDFKKYKNFSEKLAWETEVWIADMPDHMIHLNGDRFMGPR